MSVQQVKFKEIADAIREKTNSTDKIKPSEFASKVNDVYDAGKAKGIEEGKKSEHDRFWDDYQQNGNRTVYGNAFGSCWTANNFHPKYSMRPTTAYMMFHNNVGGAIVIEDFVTFCKERNIELDFSQCTQAMYALGRLLTYHHGVLDFSKCTGMMYLFYSQNSSTPSVETIDEFISSETTNFNATTFEHAINLTNVKFSGVIATGTFDVSKCTKLTHDSLVSALDHLKDFSGTNTHTAIIGSTNLAKLQKTEEGVNAIARANAKGWTVA